MFVVACAYEVDGPTKSRPDAARSRPDTARSPVIQLLYVQKGINRIQITCSLLAQYLHFVMYKTNMENEKNNVTSRYAETYTTINCKT